MNHLIIFVSKKEISRFIESTGLENIQFAKKSMLSQRTVENLRGGLNLPSADSLIKLRKHFNLDINGLIDSLPSIAENAEVIKSMPISIDLPPEFLNDRNENTKLEIRLLCYKKDERKI